MTKDQHICICSTSFANYDRRIQRISASLIKAGYQVSWMARVKEDFAMPEGQLISLRTFIHQGFLFYAAFNVILFVKLLFKKFDVLCAVDLDTLLACKLASKLKGKPLVFDAHEYFTEVPELEGRTFVKRVWTKLANNILPTVRYNYTVGGELAKIFSELYGTEYALVQNTPPLSIQGGKIESGQLPSSDGETMVYLGVVNKGRGVELAIRSLVELTDKKLKVIGGGDLLDEMKSLSEELKVQERVSFLGYVNPSEIPGHLENCWLALNLLSPVSKSYYYSLANKYFDYIHAGLPSICMDYPEYRALNDSFHVSELISEYQVDALIKGIKNLSNHDYYLNLQGNTIKAKVKLSWEKDEKRLLELYANIRRPQ